MLVTRSPPLCLLQVLINRNQQVSIRSDPLITHLPRKPLSTTPAIRETPLAAPAVQNALIDTASLPRLHCWEDVILARVRQTRHYHLARQLDEELRRGVRRGRPKVDIVPLPGERKGGEGE